MRLLVSEVKLSKILCLTFTNAAADEMLARVTWYLKSWACINDIELIESLSKLLGRNPSVQETKTARNLCHSYFQLQDNRFIQTIHSFCQEVLQKFPLEAGVRPNFRLLDEFRTKEAINYIYGNLVSGNDELLLSLKFLAHYVSEDKLMRLVYDIILYDAKFSILLVKFPNAVSYKSHLLSLFNTGFTDEDDAISNFYTRFTDPCIKEYVSKIITQKDGNRFISQLFHYQQQEYTVFVDNITKIINLFITIDGNKKRVLLNKNIKDAYPRMDKFITSLQEHAFQLKSILNCFMVINATYHFYIISVFILNEYTKYKLDNNYLDYNDLIYNTHDLFKNSTYRDWILYKLNLAIDHILIDEAQDNSAEQWGIILDLLEDALAGDTTKHNSSFFVVGDSKQSIFSFQGADTHMFNNLQVEIRNKFSVAQKTFKSLSLEVCYRSTQAILDFVQVVLEHINTSSPDSLSFRDLTQLKCSRTDVFGKVEVWDIIHDPNNNSNSQDILPLITNHEDSIQKTDLLAQQIASYIERQISSKEILPSTHQIVKGNDFMILIRKRNKFVNQLINALKTLNLRVNGVDRVILQDHLSVMDLIALAKFLITPNNDLNLAILLKSPLIGGNEQDIWFLCTQRPLSTSLWKFLLQIADNNAYYQEINSKLQRFIKLYNSTSPIYFFYSVVEVCNYRQLLINTNIEDGNDIIDEFLKVVSYFFTNFPPTMGEFLTWFDSNRIELKRDIIAQDCISITTIHGAKGLQAPIVILPDTTSYPAYDANILWDDQQNMLWLPQARYSTNTYLQSHLESSKHKNYQEYLRLFYVAMTRAKDKLIICGDRSTNAPSEKCWYQIARNSMLKMAGVSLEREEFGAVSIDKMIYTK